MNFDLYQQKLSQLEKRLKKCIAESLINNRVFTLSNYLETICVFINDFDIIEFFGEEVIEKRWLSIRLSINKHQTSVEFEWNFRVDDSIDEDRNMIYLDLYFTDRYTDIQATHTPDDGGYIRHYVSCDDVYKVQYLGPNMFFDLNLESALQKLTSDTYYYIMKDEEPIAVAIYSYSDN